MKHLGIGVYQKVTAALLCQVNRETPVQALCNWGSLKVQASSMPVGVENVEQVQSPAASVKELKIIQALIFHRIYFLIFSLLNLLLASLNKSSSQACLSKILYLSKLTKIATNAETTMLSKKQGC